MKKTYDMVLAYAKIFDLPEELRGKPGDLDRGDPKAQAKWLRELAKNPVATVDAYFTSEADVQDLLDTEGFDNTVVNPQTGEETTRIKEGNPDLGIGKYLRLKRKYYDTVEFVDKKTGNLVEIDKGGAPSVKILDTSGEKPVFRTYDYEELGAPSNGTKSKVRFEVYGKGNTRLEAFGITELIEYTGDDSDRDPMEDF